MHNNNKSSIGLTQPLQHQLRLTARVALAVSAIAALALAAMLFVLFRGQSQDNYLLIIRALTQSQDQLLPAFLIGAAVITLFAGLLVWFVLLFSSARIAGPLYRFRKNLEMEINEGPVPTIQLRKHDYLQELSSQLSATASGLMQQYRQQGAVLDDLDRYLTTTDSASPSRYAELVRRLRQTAQPEQS